MTKFDPKKQLLNGHGLMLTFVWYLEVKDAHESRFVGVTWHYVHKIWKKKK